MQSVMTYELELTDEQKLTLPEVASILHAELNENANAVRLYIYGDQDGPEIELTFYVFDTGHVLPDTFGGQHIRTLPKGDGTAHHVFMKPPPKRLAVQRGKPVVATPKASAEANPNDDGAANTRNGGDNGKA